MFFFNKVLSFSEDGRYFFGALRWTLKPFLALNINLLVIETLSEDGEDISSELCAEHCSVNRDLLCQALYNRLVAWLITRINQAVSVSMVDYHVQWMHGYHAWLIIMAVSVSLVLKSSLKKIILKTYFKSNNNIKKRIFSSDFHRFLSCKIRTFDLYTQIFLT